MKKLLIMLIAMGIFTMACENESDNISLDNPNATEDAGDGASLRVADITTSGVTLYSKYGINLGNIYENGTTKINWQHFFTYDPDLKKSLDFLESNTTGFKIYRVGFSKPMASDDADLNEWAAALKVLADHGERMIICYWPIGGDYTDAASDAKMWQSIVNKISEKGLLPYVEGWELNNEPHNGSDLAGYYTSVYNGVSDWRGKKIILDGGGYAKSVSQRLYEGTSTITNRLWAVHCYSYYVGGTEPVDMTPVQWRDEYIKAYNERYQYINGNFIVTEMGVSDNYVETPVTNVEKQVRGFVAANELYFGNKTTVFWYVGYNSAKVGLISTKDGSIRTNALNAMKRVFY